MLIVPVLLASVPGGTASADPMPTAGLTVHDFVTGLPDVPPPSPFAGVGPFGLVFDGAHHLLVSDAANLGFYSFGPDGATGPSPVTTGIVQTGLAFSKTGELFAARYQAGDIDQIDPASGALIRQLNPPGTTYPCVLALATDPISGDLFFGQPNSGPVCPGAPALTRVENPTSAHPTFVTYVATPGTYTAGLTFGPDGTLYAVQQGPSIACAARISGTRSPSPPTVTNIACFPNFGIYAGIDTIALSARPRHHPTLFVAGPDGTITKVDQSTTPATLTPIVTGGTRTDGMVVGPDGCLYATQSTTIEKITNANGTCSFVAASVLPALRLRPRHATRERLGRPVTIMAKITKRPDRRTTPVAFTVTGANPSTRTVTTNSAGVARFTYTGNHPGTDTITAGANVGTIILSSNTTTVDWQLP
ncbi:MAG: Ig-like domain-containing protein [Actinomycetota bacterium]|nr:Ig-like domain-containing protein [Actinomycetota bacterium]